MMKMFKRKTMKKKIKDKLESGIVGGEYLDIKIFYDSNQQMYMKIIPKNKYYKEIEKRIN